MNADQTNQNTTTPFYLNSFMSYNPDDDTTPKTTFAQQDVILLKWKSGGGTFTLYPENLFGTQSPTTEKSITIPKDTLTNSHTIVIKGTNGTSILYQSLTINIINPDLLPRSSNISDQLQVQNNLTVYGSSELKNTLIIDDDTTFNEALTVNGKSWVNGLDATGTVTTGGLSVLGGKVSLRRLNVSGEFITEAGSASSQFVSNVFMYGAYQNIYSTSLDSSTNSAEFQGKIISDSMLMVYFYPDGGYNTACHASVDVHYDTMTFHIDFNVSKDSTAFHCLPIPKTQNNPITLPDLTVNFSWISGANITVTLYAVPLGTGVTAPITTYTSGGS